MALSDYASMFQRYSASSGIPYNYFRTVAGIESGFNASAYNSGSGATGLFQFIPSTARQYGLTDATNAESSTDAFARFTQDNIRSFRNAFNRSPSEQEMYLMHQQGATGGINLLRNPTSPARDIVGAAAVTSNAGSWGMTAEQFVNRWFGNYNQRSTQYGGTVPTTPQNVTDASGNSPADWLQNITAGADPSKPFTPATPGEENSSGILGSISDFFGGSSTPFGIASTLFKGITGNSVADVATGAAPNTVSSDTQNILAFAENWAGRGIVIILGFIFVAVGLAMFAPKVIVNEVTKGAIRG